MDVGIVGGMPENNDNDTDVVLESAGDGILASLKHRPIGNQAWDFGISRGRSIALDTLLRGISESGLDRRGGEKPEAEDEKEARGEREGQGTGKLTHT